MTGRAEEASWVIVELLKILDKAVIWIPRRSLKRLSSESPWQTCKSYTLTLNLAEAQSSKNHKIMSWSPMGSRTRGGRVARPPTQNLTQTCNLHS